MATTLRMYPADLFERFKASNGKCGLRIGLCENLLNESYTAFTAGGAVGNLIDRVALGCVTDMIKVEFIPFFQFPVFNIADILVVLGGILLVIYVLFCWNRCERVYGKREMRKGRRQNSK